VSAAREEPIPGGPLLRIGELSRRLGVAPHVLRNWEQRYGLVSPIRGEGGYRLYSPADEARVRAMLEALEDGLAPAEAARLVTSRPPVAPAPEAGDVESALRPLVSRLSEALADFDATAANAVLDELLAGFSLETVLTRAVMPYLRELGDCWARGEVGVDQEHFASRLVEARLLGLARGWDRAPGPACVLACPPGEQHTLALIAFGVAARNLGQRIVYLGADTPIEGLGASATHVGASAIVLAATEATRFVEAAEAISAIARDHDVYLAGAGAGEQIAKACGATYLEGDPVAAAAWLASR
jgi:MerR family transcriptional regulator, light-induced transcriptional regulator